MASVTLPDLTSILHARDAAEAKVAAIGSVNPRPPGLVNALIQSFKRAIARLLEWHVRDQVEFNRSMITAVEAVLEALNENNRALGRLAAADGDAKAELRAHLASEVEVLRQELRAVDQKSGPFLQQAQELKEEAKELKDVRAHWAEWRQEWEKKLSVNEVQFLRSVADLEAGFTHRASLMESNFRDLTKSQHKEFTLALDRSAIDIQKRLWADLEKSRLDFERVIHNELRLVRQRAAAAPPESPRPAPSAEPALDWMWFAGRFRGSPDYVREKQRFYLPFFQGCAQVVDLGCGRGEFLELMQEAGVDARGVELSDECVALCKSKGLRVEKADLFSHLDGLPASALDGIFLAQVVEHLPPGAACPSSSVSRRTNSPRAVLLAIETPNPECLADLHHPLLPGPVPHPAHPSGPAELLPGGVRLRRIEIRRLSPAVESLPAPGIAPGGLPRRPSSAASTTPSSAGNCDQIRSRISRWSRPLRCSAHIRRACTAKLVDTGLTNGVRTPALRPNEKPPATCGSASSS